jgi:hypothetical protein
MLCRACGAEMVASEYCSSCNEAVLWKCSGCEKETDKSVHTYHPPRETSRMSSVVGALVSLIGMCFVVPV